MKDGTEGRLQVNMTSTLNLEIIIGSISCCFLRILNLILVVIGLHLVKGANANITTKDTSQLG